LLSSVPLALEARRALVRLAREGALTPSQFRACLDRVDEGDLTLDLCESNLMSGSRPSTRAVNACLTVMHRCH